MRLLGAVLILCAFSFGGFTIGGSMRSRCEFWERFVTALEILEAEIGFSYSDLRRAFENAAGISGLELFVIAARDIERLGINEAWRSAVDKSGLCASDRETLLLLSSKLGKTDAENQIKHIKYMLSLAGQCRDEAHDCYMKKGALCRRGGLLIGIFMVLILL